MRPVAEVFSNDLGGTTSSRSYVVSLERRLQGVQSPYNSPFPGDGLAFRLSVNGLIARIAIARIAMVEAETNV